MIKIRLNYSQTNIISIYSFFSVTFKNVIIHKTKFKHNKKKNIVYENSQYFSIIS